MPAYYNGRLYYGPVGYNLIAFQFSNAKLQTPPVSTTGTTFGYPGATPSVSANGSADAIVWATENTNPAVLHAYDASDLTKELYNSNQAGKRDQFGAGNKFITPTIANGKVYVGTTNGVGAFGLISSPAGDFSVGVSSSGSSSATVSPGQTAQYSLSLTASGGFNQSVSFTCAGAPAETSCSVSPSSATPGNSATALMVSVSTTAPLQTGSLRWRGMWPPVVILLLAMLGAVARPNVRKSHPWNSRFVPMGLRPAKPHEKQSRVAQTCRSLACLRSCPKDADIPPKYGGTYAPPWFFERAIQRTSPQGKDTTPPAGTAWSRTECCDCESVAGGRHQKNFNPN